MELQKCKSEKGYLYLRNYLRPTKRNAKGVEGLTTPGFRLRST